MTTRMEQIPQAKGHPRGKVSRFIGMFALVVVLAGSMGALLLVLAGVFQRKVPMEQTNRSGASISNLSVEEVRLVRRTRYESAVGTIRAVHEVVVASRLLARVTEVRVKAGQPVAAGEVLVRLDDSDLQARLKQAEAALVTARAEKEKADRDYERGQSLMPSGGISKEEIDRRETARRTTASEVERTEHLIQEAKVLLEYATIRAPITGIVIDKRAEAGDTATPGQVLLTLFNPKRMQMVVAVRESLARRLSVGQKVRARLESLNHECEATVSEIVPEVQTASRSLLVKVTGLCPPGVYSGMFGRIYIPLEEEERVVVPAAAIERVGQLDLVRVIEGEVLQRRSVQLGRQIDQGYEVLAGLKPGEKVVLLQEER
jgi:RND family efflux transporter MFP subunit